MNLLRGGIDYEILPDAYVIFICDFDPFEKELYRYSCRMTCLETGEVVKDGSTTILLNTHGKNPQEISPELFEFLEYVKDPGVSLETARDNRFINDLENCVAAVKQDRGIGTSATAHVPIPRFYYAARYCSCFSIGVKTPRLH